MSHLVNSQCNPAIPNNTIIVSSTSSGGNLGTNPFWVCNPYVFTVTNFGNTIYLESGASIVSDRCCQTVYVPAGAKVNLTGFFNTIYYVNAADLISTGAFPIITNCTSITYDYTNAPAGGCITLPIELLLFRGEYFNNKNIIMWETVSEVNNNYFILYRSPDGFYFDIVGVIKGSGNSSVISHYSIVDNEPYNNITYYKLTQFDYNGNFESFDIISVYNTNTSVSKLVKITNVLGQEINNSYDYIKLYYFSDGSVIKKYIVK